MPTSVQVQRKSAKTMEVTWDPSPSPGTVTGYRVYYGMLALPGNVMDQWQHKDVAGPYTVATISGLDARTSYAVRVQAVAVDGRVSNLSDIAYTNHGQNTCCTVANLQLLTYLTKRYSIYRVIQP